MRAWRRVVLGALAAGLMTLVWPPGTAFAETEVDLALVLAVDISFSMDPDEQQLQRDGFIDAFRSTLVQDAIKGGMLGRIAVTYVEWAGSGDQQVVVPWTLLDSPASANAFAATLAERPTRRAARTSISGALDFSARLLADAPFKPMRQVIDVSGDGPNNQGRPVTAARTEAVARGITINGLPIMLKSAGYFDIPNLDLYYRDCVIGGQGAFMVPAREREQFREAIKTKILMEVASRADTRHAGLSIPAPAGQPADLLRRVQSEAPSNCMAGEMQWRDRMGN